MSFKNNEGSAEAVTKKHKYLILIAAVLLVVMVGTLVLVLCLGNRKNKGVNYMRDDLSKYVSVPESAYKNYNVTLDIDEITDFDVEESIIKVLCANKIIPEGPVYNFPGVTISIGDVANVYYRGYTVGEGGVKEYFDGGCNFADTYTALEIGSGSFIAGFESGLIGKNQNDYATLTRITSGTAMPGDIINLTYSVHRANGKSELSKTVMIDLSDPNLDQRWGAGFSAYFNDEAGKKIGETFAVESKDRLIVNTITDDPDGSDIYFDMKISGAYRVGDGDRLVVEAYFPNNYTDASLEGKTGYFEVYIMSVQDYNAPELTDAFLTDTLEFTADELAEYEGEGLVAKYKSYVKSELNKERDSEIKSAIEDAFWSQVLEAAEFKKLPEVEVQKHYDNSVSEMYSTFESGYSSYYQSFDDFARAYLDLSSNADWTAYLRQNSESSVKQRLVFYYIIRQAKYIPSDSEYDEIYEDVFAIHLQDYLDYYEITEETEGYEAKLAEGKKVVKESYGSTYWEELVMYEYAMDKIIANANVTFE